MKTPKQATFPLRKILFFKKKNYILMNNNRLIVRFFFYVHDLCTSNYLTEIHFFIYAHCGSKH